MASQETKETWVAGSFSTEAAPLTSSHDSRCLVLISIANLIQTIVGSGLLALPYAFLDGGVGLGTVNIAIMGSLSLLGFLAIGQACRATGAQTYREAWVRTVGRYEAVVDAAICFETSIIMVSFMILLIDYFGVIIEAIWGLSLKNERGLLASAVAIPILLPLSLQCQLSSLRFASFVGNLSVSYCVLFVIGECFLSKGSNLNQATFVSDNSNGIFRATSVMASAYISHYNAPDIFAELSKSPRQWESFTLTVIASFGIVTVLYGAFALAGYARFGFELQGNVLLNYGTSGVVMIAWMSMVPTLVASFALHAKPSRDALARSVGLQLYGGPQAAQVSYIPFVGLTIMIIAAVVVCAVLCTDISWILAFRGALLAFPISFVLPGLMLLHCPREAKPIPCQRGFGWLLVITGVANSLLGLYCALSDKAR